MTADPILERPLTRRQLLVAGLASAGALVLAACGASSSPSASASSGGAGGGSTTTVKMTDALKFDPATISIKVGDTVHWDNAASISHSSTDDPSKAATASDAKLPSGAQPWDSGLLNPGQTFDHQFTVAGQYDYFCIPHESAGMLGHITVA
ncbi:MAG: cupredoxin domain-containing protein [Candidatus Limnocylindrales bacterium]